MAFDIDAYKTARIREMENEARDDLAKAVSALHERASSLESKLDALIEMVKAVHKKKD